MGEPIFISHQLTKRKIDNVGIFFFVNDVTVLTRVPFEINSKRGHSPIFVSKSRAFPLNEASTISKFTCCYWNFENEKGKLN